MSEMFCEMPDGNGNQVEMHQFMVSMLRFGRYADGRLQSTKPPQNKNVSKVIKPVWSMKLNTLKMRKMFIVGA